MDILWIKFEYKSNHWYQKYHLLHNFVRDPILAVLMIFCHDYPILQVSSVTVVMIISVSLDIKYMPFKEPLKNKMMILVGILFVVVNLGYCVLAYMSNTLKAKTKHVFVGNLLIVAISAVFIIELVFNGVQIYRDMKEECKKKKYKKKMEKLAA